MKRLKFTIFIYEWMRSGVFPMVIGDCFAVKDRSQDRGKSDHWLPESIESGSIIIQSHISEVNIEFWLASRYKLAYANPIG